MGRLLIFALAVFGLIWLLKRALDGHTSDAAGQAPGERGAPGDLVRCAHCGLHLPRGEAHAAGERLYCSEEHARLGPEGE
ncbi:MAG TPA: PP0621 family protein [Burkholderiales bacterium]|nr:PP0621 family protein [Burkholderiales bacterium]